MEHRHDELAPPAGAETAESVATPGSSGPLLSAGPVSPAQLIALQGSAGNAAVLRLLSGQEQAGIRNEPPFSTATAATSPEDVVAPVEEEDVALEPLPAERPPASGAEAPLPVPEAGPQEAEHAEPAQAGNAPSPGPSNAPTLPPAGAPRDDVMTALRGAAGAKKADAAWVTYVNGAFPAGSDDARLARNLLQFGPEASWPAPTAGALIPFDTAPLSLPKERIIFNCTWTPSAGVEFHEIVVTASEGKFVSGGGTTVTVKGLVTDNLDFLIPAAWTGSPAITVKAEVRPRGSATVLTSKSWTFNKKTVCPTTMTQKEGEGEVALGSVYEYKLGPAVTGKRAPFYEHQTILETFPGGTCNITPADLTDAFKAANPALTDSEKINTHFFGGSGGNGTFTVSPDDKIWDGHSGILSRKADIEPHLKAWKEIHNDLFQVYEAEPGKPLGKYTIRRIIKVDGSLAMKKFKTP